MLGKLSDSPSVGLYYTTGGVVLRSLATQRTTSPCRDRPPHAPYRSSPPPAPVLGLADLGTGVEHWFASLGRFQARATHGRHIYERPGHERPGHGRPGHGRHVTIGSSPACDIAVAGGDRISPQDCTVELTAGVAIVRTSVTTPGAVTVSGLPLRPGSQLELVQGAVLRVGDSALVALGHPVDPAPAIAARTLDEFMLASLHVHGSVRAAAAALGIARSTFHDRLKKALERRSI